MAIEDHSPAMKSMMLLPFSSAPLQPWHAIRSVDPPENGWTANDMQQ